MMSKNEGIPIYTESSYRNGQMKARGAIVADFLTEIQSIESQTLRNGILYHPDMDFKQKSIDYRDGFLAALQYMRVKFERNHDGATREAKRLIGKATSQAYALSSCAHFLLELAKGEDDDH
jgi:hypothetical protein